MAEFYKVTNTSDEPIHTTWMKALLSDEELEEYEAFKQTPEYVGINADEISARKKIPEAIKVRPFLDSLGHDVKVRVTDRVMIGEQAVSQGRYEWQFCIGPNVEEILKKGKLARARKICQDFEIPVTKNHTIEELVAKIVGKFGKNVKILTQRQWIESGLQQIYEYRAREMKLQAGQLKAKIINTGGPLVAEEMTDIDVEEFNAEPEVNSKSNQKRVNATKNAR